MGSRRIAIFGQIQTGKAEDRRLPYGTTAGIVDTLRCISAQIFQVNQCTFHEEIVGYVEQVLYQRIRIHGSTPSDGSVAVIVESAGRSVQVAVEDTGAGLVPGGEHKIFERFWRADDARTRPEGGGGGAGLGLAIARGLVEAHGGTIWAETRPDGGARIIFALPIAAVA